MLLHRAEPIEVHALSACRNESTGKLMNIEFADWEGLD
jgi:hypothetical protein